MKRAVICLLAMAFLAGCGKPETSNAVTGNATCRTINEYMYDHPVLKSKASNDWFSDAIIIGDSRAGSLALYSDLASKGAEIIYDESLGIYSFQNTNIQMSSSTAYDILLKSDRKKIYLWLGINEIRYDVNDWKETYRNTVSEIISSHPDAQIYLIGTLYPKALSGLSGEELVNAVDAQNSALQSICEEFHVYFIDMNEDMSGDDHIIDDAWVWGDYALNNDGAQKCADLLSVYTVKEEDYVYQMCE